MKQRAGEEDGKGYMSEMLWPCDTLKPRAGEITTRLQVSRPSPLVGPTFSSPGRLDSSRQSGAKKKDQSHKQGWALEDFPRYSDGSCSELDQT